MRNLALVPSICLYHFFFFNDTATTEIYTLSLHDALPIFGHVPDRSRPGGREARRDELVRARRSEEHTSELQSRSDIVCRLLLEKKKDTWLPCLRLIAKVSWCRRYCPPLSRDAPGRSAYRMRFLFNDTATTEIYTLSLHDALPI